MNNFKSRVKETVKKIPRGKVLSYRQVAARAGSPRASRAVGNIMKNNFDCEIPCHRVIRSDGKVGAYNRGGPRKKAALLRQEGFFKQTRSRVGGA